MVSAPGLALESWRLGTGPLCAWAVMAPSRITAITDMAAVVARGDEFPPRVGG